MLGAREIIMLFIGWMMQLGFISGMVFAVYKINDLHKQMDELREDVRIVRDRMEAMPPVQ